LIKSILRSNIRFKLVVSPLSIVFLTGTLTIIIGLNILNKNVIREAYDNVRTSLAAIDELYREDVARRSQTIQYLAKTSEIVRATAAADRATLHDALGRIRRDFGFDIVNVVDPQGTVLVRANNPDAFWGQHGLLSDHPGGPQDAGPGRRDRSPRLFEHPQRGAGARRTDPHPGRPHAPRPG